MSAGAQLETNAINTIRFLSIDAIEKANSGHPGLPMGAAPMAFALWQNHLTFCSQEPKWTNRDRFVLSAGHGSMLLYSLLHLYGYDLSIKDIQEFRQFDSKTPGHPECFMTPGVETTTGPLGQGTANAVGLAMAERFLANRFNRPNFQLVDHYTYALVSDGDLMEGVAHEAAALAGHLGLGKLIYLYDANDVTLDGPAELAFTEDIEKRYESYGWHVQTVTNGDDGVDEISQSIARAKETAQPSLIVVKTTIGFGSPNKGGKSSSHGSPLGTEEVKATREALGWNYAPFVVPDEVGPVFEQAIARGQKARDHWQVLWNGYSKQHPELAKEFETCSAGKLPHGWADSLPMWNAGEKIATRSAAGKVQNVIAGKVPWLLGGDADLGCSTKTLIDGAEDFAGSGAGRNIRFGVREHAMASICNGLHSHGGIRPYAATFFVFSDYMRPAVRIAAMNGQPVVYIWTHDSIGLGEDGPTHQPVEQLMSLRVIPNLHVVRPADANEAQGAWRYAMERSDGPVALVLSRQNLPVLPGSISDEVFRGAYVVQKEQGELKAILIATGSEVSLACDAAGALPGVRVVSMPCWEAFEAQNQAYQESILPRGIDARISIEAGATLGWQKWVGQNGATIGLDRFGASAPGPEVYAKLGFTVERIQEALGQFL